MIESLDKEMILILSAEICREVYISEVKKNETISTFPDNEALLDAEYHNIFNKALIAGEEFHNRMTQAIVDFHSAKEQELKQQIENENKKAN